MQYRKFFVEDKISGGLADNKSLQDIADKHKVSLDVIQTQFDKGLKVEKEHTSDEKKATEIVKDHLWEFPTYYDGLEDMEKKLENYKRIFNEEKTCDCTQCDKKDCERRDAEFQESIEIPLEAGDTFKFGKWKNKSGIYDSSYIDDKGDLIIKTQDGKEIQGAKIRIVKQESKQFSEALRFSDLYKSAMSAFTKDFAKETSKLMGAPTKHSKLVQFKVNKKQDYVTFLWVTERTPKYDDNFNTQVVNPKTMTLQKDNLYTIEIRVLDFFKLLKTSPNKPITNKDIEDVFKVADIKIWDDTPSFQFQGSNYILTTFDAAIYPETRPPKVWNTKISKYGKTHNSNQFLSKHSAGIVTSIAFWYPIMRQMIKKYLKGQSG